MEECTRKESLSCKFSSIAILDLETSNLPSFNNNRTKITELCIFGFASSILEKCSCSTSGAITTADEISVSVPKTPRVLHKLTLLFNPQKMIHPDGERITGLSNYILEDESIFDENAGNTILGFIQHLQQPVCLVAHNGWAFDFPLVKEAMEKLKKELPSNTVCVDSLRAFLEIDKNLEATGVSNNTYNKIHMVVDSEGTTTDTVTDIALSSDSSIEADMLLLTDALTENSQFNWRTFNECTPKRPPRDTTNSHRVPIKRKLFAEYSNIVDDFSTKLSEECHSKKRSVLSKSSCSLYFGPDASPIIKKYPPRNIYKLGNIYKRIFKQEPKNAHHAEADVEMLMQLIIHYGAHFVAYAKQHARPLSDVPKLGRY